MTIPAKGIWLFNNKQHPNKNDRTNELLSTEPQSTKEQSTNFYSTDDTDDLNARIKMDYESPFFFPTTQDQFAVAHIWTK